MAVGSSTIVAITRRQYRLRAGMAIAVIVAAQMLLLTHAFEHPVLDPQPCTTCLYCHNTSHALAPTSAMIVAAVLPARPELQPLADNVFVASIPRSIRAPPRLPAMV